jgi:hypothetical protein
VFRSGKVRYLILLPDELDDRANALMKFSFAKVPDARAFDHRRESREFVVEDVEREEEGAVPRSPGFKEELFGYVPLYDQDPSGAEGTCSWTRRRTAGGR